MRLRAISPLIMVCLLVIGNYSFADDGRLEGSYRFSGASMRSDQNEPQDTHIVFELRGDTAKALYGRMKVPEKKSECLGDVVKRIGSMECLIDGDSYHCVFSIDISGQKIEAGYATC